LYVSSSSEQNSSSSGEASSSSEYLCFIYEDDGSGKLSVISSSSYNPQKEFCDSRDGTVYKWVKIGTQIWMAENMKGNYNQCFHYDTVCDYGGLYYYNTAVNDACPNDMGWYLPSNEEWTLLKTYAGEKAGTNLKSKTVWEIAPNIPTGSNTSSFEALPGGYSNGTSNLEVGFSSNWWSNDNQMNNTYHWTIRYDSEEFNNTSENNTSNLYSVRCICRNETKCLNP